MEDEIDFDDLLGETRAYQEPQAADIAAPVTQEPKPPLPDLAAAPTERELILAKQVQDLQEERQALQSELELLKAERPQPDIQPDQAPGVSTSTSPNGPINIPHDILPVLSILRKHIAELSHENAALRYVFLGGPIPGSARSSGSAAQADGPGGDAGTGTDMERIEIEGAQNVKLGQIVTRVKELVRENEELGELVLTLGRTSPEVWQQALDDSRAVIESLDGDLTQHLATIQDLRSQLEESKRSKPPPTGRSQPSHPSDAPRAPIGPSLSSQAPASNRAPARHTPLIRPHHSHRPSSSSTSIASGTQNGSRQMGILGAAKPASDTLALPERDKRRERDRDSQGSGLSGGGSGGGGSRSHGHGHGGGGGGSGSGSGRRDQQGNQGVKDPPRGPREDRDYKRRR